MKRYGLIPIDQKDMNIYEREILILLYRYSNFNTDIAGYTVGQLVASYDKVLGLTLESFLDTFKYISLYISFICFSCFFINLSFFFCASSHNLR